MTIPKVFSFPRSGTHYLMATLKRNFYPNVDFPRAGIAGGHWANLVSLPAADYSFLFGGHGLISHKPPPKDALCLYRDGRDVAVSLWRTKSLQHPDWRGLSFSEFLRKPLDWYHTPGIRADYGFSVPKLWKRHVTSWLVHQNRTHDRPKYVRYEELLLHLEATLDRLASELEIVPWSWPPKPVEEKVGIEPHQGIVGGWRDVFSEEDLIYFHSIVPRDFPGLWEE